MITRRTVLILGAGASAPYGFPLGRALLLMVARQIMTKDRHVYGLLAACGFAAGHMSNFADQLVRSNQPSVDAFLENRPEFLDVGKAAIAAALIPYEDGRKLLRIGNDPQHSELLWYEYLFRHLAPTLADYERGKLSVITFNYDRSLEHSLFMALSASFGASDDETKRLLQLVPLIHVYGQLGALDYMAPDGRPYVPVLTPRAVKKCASEIKIIHEARPDTTEFAEAHRLLSQAEVVCFLGFGYHKENMERLQVDQLIPEGAQIYACVTGMAIGEVDAIRPMLEKHRGQTQFGSHGHDALTFLRNNLVLR